ncbi:hypothetical protein L1N85_14010 [Paenibacillus alkaliterrae]|uniref:hypothetical protein n=1 Tax=Paenibacillus alkaliterrae TaxID=320909 RepID=UPI001F1AB0B3|nr:hypothetical protein [Paenibacillus alkaliterrae]MCF2939534.1 hypothetical protein [Paenibacillus alkaliterrae]
MLSPIEPQLNRDYIVSQLEILLNLPSPSGYCMGIMKYMEEEIERLGYSLEVTPKGNGMVTIAGPQVRMITG